MHLGDGILWEKLYLCGAKPHAATSNYIIYMPDIMKTKTAFLSTTKRKTSLLLATLMLSVGSVAQTMQLNVGSELAGKRFDGIGAVNGGGATSVLLKDYPEPQRSQILDMVYRPKFGASVSTLLVEIPGDGNSTQGSMPSHSHFRGDYNFRRGYTWWVLREAKRRNPSLSLDATGWSAPGWVGNGNFWSQDGADYYVAWMRGLEEVYGLRLDALGCRNERGSWLPFAKMLRETMNSSGFADVRLHGFDNWGDSKLDFLREMQQDTAMASALDIISAHTFSEVAITPEQRAAIDALGKPIWNSEDHVYRPGFDCLITIVKCFNENYIVSGATKVVNWYDIGGVYPLEPYSEDPPMLLAREPWSGHYVVRQALWGYAHYGQFTEAGWHYVDDACRKLDGGGSVCMLRAPEGGDYSLIFETKEAKQPQTITIRLPKSLSTAPLCVWTSDANEQFVRRNDIVPRGRKFTITLQPGTVYSLSTTRGQQKGGFEQIPASQPFPLPYNDDFEHYGDFAQWGYLPHYLADLLGCFELTERPEGDGTCIRQVVGAPTNSWAPEWHYYTILGDSAWTDYEVSADVYLNPQDEAGVMGRLCHVGSGYGVWAKGYYLKLNPRGDVTLHITRGKLNPAELIGDAEQQALILARKDNEVGGEYTLDSVRVSGISACQWHRLSLRMEGAEIVGCLDGKPVVRATEDRYAKGMAGLLAPRQGEHVSTPYFDNLSIRPLGHSKPTPTTNWPQPQALYTASDQR